MKHTLSILLISLITSTCFSKEPAVIPLQLNADQLQDQEIYPGQDAFVRVEYRIKPGGEVLFSEEAEKLWWLGEQPVLMLGSSGQPLPAELSGRVSLYLTVTLDVESVLLQDHLIHPLRQSVPILSSPTALAEALSTSVSMDAIYLAEVANYLAGNLSAVSITASSYDVNGYGPVITSGGVWTGEPIGSSSIWTSDSTSVFIQDKNVGIGTNSPGADLEVEGTHETKVNVKSQLTEATLSVVGDLYGSEIELHAFNYPMLNFYKNETHPGAWMQYSGNRLEIVGLGAYLVFNDKKLRIADHYSYAYGEPTGLLHLLSLNNNSEDTLLTIESGHYAAELRLDSDATAASQVSFYAEGSHEAMMGYIPSDDTLYFQNLNGGSTYFLTDGFGIGTSSPSSDLHVYEDSGNAITTIEADSGTSYVILDATTGNSEIQFKTNNVYKGAFGYNSSSDYLYWYKGGNVVLKGGNLGIGTLTPAGKLDVNGAIYQRGSQIHSKSGTHEVGSQMEPIEEHASFFEREKYLPAIPQPTIDETGHGSIELGAHRRGVVEELEKAHIYIEQLKQELEALKLLVNEIATNQ